MGIGTGEMVVKGHKLGRADAQQTESDQQDQQGSFLHHKVLQEVGTNRVPWATAVEHRVILPGQTDTLAKRVPHHAWLIKGSILIVRRIANDFENLNGGEKGGVNSMFQKIVAVCTWLRSWFVCPGLTCGWNTV
jgi:hypothetical protein